MGLCNFYDLILILIKLSLKLYINLPLITVNSELALLTSGVSLVCVGSFGLLECLLLLMSELQEFMGRVAL